MQTTELRFWEVNADANKDAIFADPTLLWNTAKGYFNYCADNPIMQGKKEGSNQFLPKVQTVTVQGLCLYLGCSPEWFSDFKEDLTDKENDLTDHERALLTIINRIEEVIYLYKYNYAAAGLLNVRMVLRDLDQDEEKNRDNGKLVWRVRVADDDE